MKTVSPLLFEKEEGEWNMIECPHCHQDLADDSDYCMYCGYAISRTAQETVEKTQKKKVILKKNPNPNHLGIFSLAVMLVAMIGFDFILASIVATITNTTAKWVFSISSVLYLTAIILAAVSLWKDHLDKKSGYETGKSTYAIAVISVSVFTVLLNLTNVLLK